MAVSYKEQVDSESPAQFGFGPDGGRAVTPYFCSSENLVDSIEDLLGYTETETSGGRLVRHLPRAHPRFPWLFVTALPNAAGLGKFTKVASSGEVLAPAVSHGTSYTQYRLQVEFQPRPYAVLPDSKIIPAQLSWTDVDGTAKVTQYVPEWKRFTVAHHTPGVELITSQQGQMLLRRNDGDDPDEFPFPGMPTIRLARRAVAMTWFQVPYRYLTSERSVLASFAGHVNQFDWNGFSAGSLLYNGCGTSRIYTRTFPAFEEGSGAYSPDLMADFVLNFEHVVREAGSTPPTPANANWVAAGHNLQPWFGDRKFYYATSFDPSNPADTSKWYPAYFSKPFEMLFTDPEELTL